MTTTNQTTTDPPASPPLWVPNQRIEIIGLTGEYESGKTVFGLTIDPARTRMYDEEKSGASYLSLGFDRVDIIAECGRKYPHGFTPLQVYEWWLSDIRSIPPGKYRVIMLDTVGTVEAGLADWVGKNPKHFGHTSGQYEKMAGLFWGDVKEHWKLILSDLASRCETFVFTTHMGNVFKGNAPTGKRKPKGKETLMELASLYLMMERTPDKDGNKPAQPSAVVLKSRLAHAKIDPQTGDPVVVPLLPPRLPVATPSAIRRYLLSPPDYSKLRPEERAQERGLSADERLELETARAIAEAETARLRMDAAGGKAGAGATTPDPKPATPGMATAAQIEEIKELGGSWLKVHGSNPPDKEANARIWQEKVMQPFGKQKVSELTEAQAGELIARLRGENTGPTAGLFGASANGQAHTDQQTATPTAA